ncbi:malate dehydrogenase (quinone) [Halobacillus salinus]|uniref:Probable malate:quinone oxidoreductase n=1 Tax=Halobacillus salinus TaxID=192814 RepID=A0A4Z0GX08_9BACI|nr:malate dehydrogenase (quinone) [Halobacillus salinus]TGB01189.1 malate dehydrogenase (quinone) [Halobacillus salinus]
MSKEHIETDVILIGAGVMSATLGTMLKEVAPYWNIKVFEKLDSAGKESSNEWNNAGTGHAALCELNYTKEQEDGSVDISKALDINEKFRVSQQFWSYLANRNVIESPSDFIRPLPHISFVRGERDVEFLSKRYEAMSEHPLFRGMQFTDQYETLKNWMPLMMKDRDANQPVAATKVDAGTDVNFGELTRLLMNHLEDTDVDVQYQTEVYDVERQDDESWEVKVRNFENGTIEHHKAKFVFVGSGGGSLHLLQKSKIPEGRGIGGFPVSGLFLVCQKPDIVAQHDAKVYSKAPVGAPPMSVPHLDRRFIENKETLLFGPFAGFSPKFLKTGSMSDLITSVKRDNLVTMSASGLKNASLTKYLIQQLLLSKEQRMEELREFVPEADSEDWELVVAGQRVQIIKDTEEGKGTLRFGTEVVSSEDGTLAALLGASPGASTAVSIMLELMDKCFPEYMGDWEEKLKDMIPSYGQSLIDNPELMKELEHSTAQALGLDVQDSSGKVYSLQ